MPLIPESALIYQVPATQWPTNTAAPAIMNSMAAQWRKEHPVLGVAVGPRIQKGTSAFSQYFAGLPPEDKHRISAVARQRWDSVAGKRVNLEDTLDRMGDQLVRGGLITPESYNALLDNDPAAALAARPRAPAVRPQAPRPTAQAPRPPVVAPPRPVAPAPRPPVAAPTPQAPAQRAPAWTPPPATQHAPPAAKRAEAQAEPEYDWDGTLVPQLPGDAKTYLAGLAALARPQLSARAAALGDRPIDIATARPPMFHQAIRDTAGRLGLNIRRIAHAPDTKVEHVRASGRPIIDNSPEVVNAVRAALGQHMAEQADTHELKSAYTSEERLRRLYARQGRCQDCGASRLRGCEHHAATTADKMAALVIEKKKRVREEEYQDCPQCGTEWGEKGGPWPKPGDDDVYVCPKCDAELEYPEMTDDEIAGFDPSFQAVFRKHRDDQRARRTAGKAAQAPPDRRLLHMLPEQAMAAAKTEGLLSSKALAARPDLLALAMPDPEGRAAWLKRLADQSSGWDHRDGPNLSFTAPPAGLKLPDNHPTVQRKLVPVRVLIDRLLADAPKTRLYGMELEPYEAVIGKIPDAQWEAMPRAAKDEMIARRKRDLTPSEFDELAAKSPEDLWRAYKPTAEPMYAPDVPHVAVITPDGRIDPKYLEFEDAAKQAAAVCCDDITHGPTMRAAVNTQATRAQMDAGNYEKAHIHMHGLRITIETPAGATRSGVSKAGVKWSVRLKHSYGYIKGTKGADGDHVDVFIGPDPASEIVFIIEQNKPGTDTFDETKCVLGCTTEADAKALYAANYSAGWKGFRAIHPCTIDQFKWWLAYGDHSKPMPAKGMFAAHKKAGTTMDLSALRPKLAGLLKQAITVSPDVPMYQRPVSATLGRLGAPLTALMLGTTAPLRPGATREFVENDPSVAAYERDRGAADAEGDIELQINPNRARPIDNLGRVWRRRGVTVPTKAVGTFASLLADLQGTLGRATHYNPAAHSLTQYDADPAILAHELGHARDFSQRTYKGPYALARHVPGVSLYQEGRASNMAADNAAPKDWTRLQRVLGGGLGTYVGGTAGNILSAVSRAPPGVRKLITALGAIAGGLGGQAIGAAVHPFGRRREDVKAHKHDKRETRDEHRKLLQLDAEKADQSQETKAAAALTGLVRLRVVSPTGSARCALLADTAMTPAARALGMQKYASPRAHLAMLFDTPGPYWAAKIAFPLDLLFLDAEGRVLDIQNMPVAKTAEDQVRMYRCRAPGASSALETVAGWADAAGVVVGDRVCPA